MKTIALHLWKMIFEVVAKQFLHITSKIRKGETWNSYCGPSWKDLNLQRGNKSFELPPIWLSKCLGDGGRGAQENQLCDLSLPLYK